jgi:hypothetical protein
VERHTACTRRAPSRAVALALLALLSWAADLRAGGQTAAPPLADPAAPPVIEIIRADAPPAAAAPGGILQAGCSTCGTGLIGGLRAPDLGDFGGAGCGGAGCGNCVPGRKPCDPHLAESVVGRFWGGIYNCICCPDPCYEGKWYPLADAALFTEAVRPVTQQRFRWASGQNVLFPDRSEFFWARADGNGRGPKPVAPFRGEKRLRYNDLILVTEGGTGTITVIAETPYRNVQPDLDPHGSGFGDLAIGTKTLLFDCELLQIAMLFKTFIPVGNVVKGVGNGHVSLEPSLLVGLKLSPTTYLQTQLSEWIPLGGDQHYAGSVLRFNASVNQELYRILPDVPLIGTFEFNTLSFQDGQYTDPLFGPQKSSGYTYASLGGGLRLFICDKVDFGIGALFSVSRQHLARELYHAEFRVRF